MAKETPCQTSGAVYGVAISPDMIMVAVTMPTRLTLTEEQVDLLKTNLHNALELVLVPLWHQPEVWKETK